MKRLWLLVFIFNFLWIPNLFGQSLDEVKTCEQNLLKASSLIKSVSDKASLPTFGAFIRSGSRAQLYARVLILGSGNPKKGGRKLFNSAKTIVKQNKSKILETAKKCKKSCSLVTELAQTCKNLNAIASNLTVPGSSSSRAMVDLLIELKGLNGLDKKVKKQAKKFYSDRS